MTHPHHLLSGLALSLAIATGANAAGLTSEHKPFGKTRDGTPVELTAKELELLLLFARHPGRAFSRQELLDRVWGVQFSGYAHTVNTHINRLRAKIEPDPAAPTYVQTVWGIGYRFREGAGA